MSNKVIGDYTAAATIDGSTNYLLIQPGNSSTAYKKINRNVFLGVTGQPVDISSSQNLTNKTLDNTNTVTLKDTLFTLQDNSDTTKQARFELSGLTTATIRTYTLPDASTTIVGTGTTQTLTNKTLTAPTITNGSITGTTITTDAIVGQSASTNGTIYGITVTSGTIGTAAIANAAVTPSKLATGTTRAIVLTSETTTSTTYTDLATTTDSVTVTIGNNGVALVSFYTWVSNNTSNAKCYVTFAISGATTSAAADNRSLEFQAYSGNAEGRYSVSYLVTGLTAGSNTFKMKYRVETGGSGSGTGTFKDREISVLPL